MLTNEMGNVGFGGLFGSIGHFFSNAAKVAGREIGHVASGIQDVAGKVSNAVGSIPIVGAPLHAVFDATYHLAMGPINAAVAVAIEGKRIDSVILDQLKTELHDVKGVAPYAQMVVSLVPGVGPGVSGAMSAGLALAQGQSIADALKAGAVGMIPGGPLVQAAVSMGTETIQSVAAGHAPNLESLAATAGGAAASALGVPGAAKDALMAGLHTVGNIANGKPIDKAVIDGAVAGMPVSPSVKAAIAEASGIASDLAHGKRVDQTILNNASKVAGMLPVGDSLRHAIQTGVTVAKKAGEGGGPALAAALQSGVADTLIDAGSKALPADVRKGIQTGIALGSGAVAQIHRATQLLNVVPGKLAESGIQLAKTSPLFGEARRIAGAGSRGFDLASGLLAQKSHLFDISTLRNSLDEVQKKGFDMALAARIGAVAHPLAKKHVTLHLPVKQVVSHPSNGTLSPMAQAGHAITMGMQSYAPDKKAALMAEVQKQPSAAVGATVAVKSIVEKRESLWHRILHALGLT